MARGGRRTGAPGVSYPNRRDLQVAPRAAPGQTYGEAGAQLAAQRAQPIAAPPQPAPAAPASGPPGSTGPIPGSLGRLDRDSDRPDIPVTAGAALGPGPGMEALRTAGDDDLDEMRALYRRFPSEELRQIIEEAESE